MKTIEIELFQIHSRRPTTFRFRLRPEQSTKGWVYYRVGLQLVNSDGVVYSKRSNPNMFPSTFAKEIGEYASLRGLGVKGEVPL